MLAYLGYKTIKCYSDRKKTKKKRVKVKKKIENITKKIKYGIYYDINYVICIYQNYIKIIFYYI
jgi:hypothetical protein